MRFEVLCPIQIRSTFRRSLPLAFALLRSLCAWSDVAGRSVAIIAVAVSLPEIVCGPAEAMWRNMFSRTTELRQSRPKSKHTKDHDTSKAKVLTCHNPAHGLTSGEENGQQEQVINVGGGERGHACYDRSYGSDLGMGHYGHYVGHFSASLRSTSIALPRLLTLLRLIRRRTAPWRESQIEPSRARTGRKAEMNYGSISRAFQVISAPRSAPSQLRCKIGSAPLP
jgi:hypothetical protein